MDQSIHCNIAMPGGGELTIAAMDKYQRFEIGRKTYLFVRRVMRNPEYRRMVEERIAQKRAAGGEGIA